MKRRDFIKTIPAAALLPVAIDASSEGAEAAGAQSSSGSSGGGGSPQRPKGFRVVDLEATTTRVRYDHIHCDQFGIDARGQAHRGQPDRHGLRCRA